MRLASTVDADKFPMGAEGFLKLPYSKDKLMAYANQLELCGNLFKRNHTGHNLTLACTKRDFLSIKIKKEG